MGWARDLYGECKRLTSHVTPEYEEEKGEPMIEFYELLIQTLEDNNIPKTKRTAIHSYLITYLSSNGYSDKQIGELCDSDPAFDKAYIDEYGAV